MANKIVLHTPIKSEDLVDLKIGDIVYLTGKITTCRDVAHRRLIEEKRALPVNLEGGAIFHAGPDRSPHPWQRRPIRNGIHWTYHFHAYGKVRKSLH